MQGNTFVDQDLDVDVLVDVDGFASCILILRSPGEFF